MIHPQIKVVNFRFLALGAWLCLKVTDETATIFTVYLGGAKNITPRDDLDCHAYFPVSVR
jgi:hypothetical protein